MGAPVDSPSVETWERDDGASRTCFEIETHIGKPLDLTRFRHFSAEETHAEVERLRQATERLYPPAGERRRLSLCPACQEEAEKAHPSIVMYGVPYHRCPRCWHAFVLEQPSAERLAGFFATSAFLAAVYTDSAAAETRMQQVILPKLAWVRERYEGQYGRAPRSVLDVGAGGGHFVAGCLREGLRAEGYEVNRSAVRFSRESLGVSLRECDFLESPPGADRFDVVTLWGVLEYVPEPRRFLERARQALADRQGLLVVEVPRFDSLSTAAQAVWSGTPTRHAVPSSHLNLFSDASLATCLADSGLRPVAAWYFGMDAYELLVQQALTLGSADVVERLAAAIPGLQAVLDSHRLCDDVVVAAVPA
jgi:SAM-dependent methyltransferase